jgi:hypothetical protein
MKFIVLAHNWIWFLGTRKLTIYGKFSEQSDVGLRRDIIQEIYSYGQNQICQGHQWPDVEADG